MIPPTAAGIIGTEFMIAYLASTATYILNTTKETLRYPQKLCALIPIWRAREYSKYRTPLALDLSYFNLFRFHVQTVWRKQGVSLTSAWRRPENLHWFEAAAYHSKQAVLSSWGVRFQLTESQYASKCSSPCDELTEARWSPKIQVHRSMITALRFCVVRGVWVDISAGGLVDALQRRPPLPVPRAGAPVAIVLTRQLQSDGKSSRVIRRWNLCMLSWLKKKEEKGKIPGSDSSSWH